MINMNLVIGNQEEQVIHMNLVIGNQEEQVIHIGSPRCFHALLEADKFNFHKDICLQDTPFPEK